ncbi:hypothetical protein CGCF413_v014245 [Colletotrichum fructicola]|nr:hypothetical protein CGCF413_v014245 [Colletotrichum fructicola]
MRSKGSVYSLAVQRKGTATNANGHDQETQLPDSARLEPQVQLDDGVALDIGNRQLFLYSTLPVYGHSGVGPREQPRGPGRPFG